MTPLERGVIEAADMMRAQIHNGCTCYCPHGECCGDHLNYCDYLKLTKLADAYSVARERMGKEK
jgi:hypothetical protein